MLQLSAMRVLGIDPGTGSWDVFGYELKNGTRTIIVDETLKPNKNAPLDANYAAQILKIIEKKSPWDMIIAPSGFGLPLKKVQELTDEDIFKITLRRASEAETMGLGHFLKILRGTDLPAFVIPGVKHLPTVPRYRKINRVDLGTADKVCSVVAATRYLMRARQTSASEASFILLEIGTGFSAALAVEGGKIIAGTGGSNLTGLKAMGAIDGELAYLMHIRAKRDTYQGGITHILQRDAINITLPPKSDHDQARPPQESLTGALDLNQKAQNYLLEQLSLAILQLASLFKPRSGPLPILLSCSGISQHWLAPKLRGRLDTPTMLHSSPKFSIEPLQSEAKNAKLATQGAAFMAEGILGGEYAEIIKNLEILEAQGDAFDEIYVDLPRK